MKKSLKAILLGAVVMTLLCVSAMAADPATTEGFHSIKNETTNVDIDVYQEDGKTEVSDKAANVDGNDVNDFYADGVRMKVTYTGDLKAGDQYLVMLVEGDELPTAETAICYIDQKASASDAENGTIVFDVFPKLPTASKDLTLYITSNAAGFEQIPISVSYLAPPYLLGDTDLDGALSVKDALWTLQALAGNRSLGAVNVLAADADKSSNISVKDALFILQAVAGNRVL